MEKTPKDFVKKLVNLIPDLSELDPTSEGAKKGQEVRDLIDDMAGYSFGDALKVIGKLNKEFREKQGK